MCDLRQSSEGCPCGTVKQPDGHEVLVTGQGQPTGQKDFGSFIPAYFPGNLFVCKLPRTFLHSVQSLPHALKRQNIDVSRLLKADPERVVERPVQNRIPGAVL